jgi:hypothetical protein
MQGMAENRTKRAKTLRIMGVVRLPAIRSVSRQLSVQVCKGSVSESNFRTIRGESRTFQPKRRKKRRTHPQTPISPRSSTRGPLCQNRSRPQSECYLRAQFVRREEPGMPPRTRPDLIRK